MMTAATGQLCSRARFWVSLRVDGELSELEGALLDAHLGRCADCRSYAGGVAATTVALRDASLVPAPTLTVAAPVRPRRIVAGLVAATMIVLAALVGGLIRENTTSGVASTAAATRNVAVVATVETPDQLRRLRRTTLLNQRVLPRDISREPY